MGEQKTIESVPQPATRRSLVSDLQHLGLHPGQVVLVHSSMSSLGWISGGPVSVIQALMDVLTPDGALVMPAHSSDYSDPAHWENPPVPEAWQETIRQTMPLFDPQRTPTRGIGRIPELFRTWPDVVRSDHPQMSFSAWGKYAQFVTEGHDLAFSLGETSPLARVYDLDGHVLMLGTGYDSNTSLHLSEYRVPNPPLTQNSAPWLENGVRVWKSFPDIEFNDDLFPRIGESFEGLHDVSTGPVAAAACKLISQRKLVDFGTAWIGAQRQGGRPS